MTLDSYKVFFTVAKEGQFSKAATVLYLSQPAVSQSVKQLEGQLGCVLFNRTAKGVELTYEGDLLFGHLKKAFEHIEAAELAVIAAKNLEVGEIKIGASDSVCSHYLLDHLQTFKDKFPEIKVHVYNKTSSEVRSMLKSGEVEIGFVNMPLDGQDGLEVIDVMPLQDCFVHHPEFSSDLKGEKDLSQLAGYPLVVLEKGTNMRRFFDSIMHGHQVDYTADYELGSADLVVKFAIKKFGIAFVTREFCESEIASGALDIIRLKEEIPKRSIGMVTVKGKKLSSAAKEFYQQCLDGKAKH
ncbi:MULTISPECIES: LysR family transcriptional regulator [unclassified Fusibacter]|uniref:LysR family transcriptional regulator n=1 Tax=unclassified Fusibacter TaxID=2624464 RepID=UPI0013E8F87B|nr:MULTISPECIES: LysR family transcriptional regulator [unclassified Fusibacter]MCK8060816.1 LysR family transcriptional regulator [Fusibacter sp. A2]NPE23112.1 LysR family transcriptional regulator [Fusibacter sp. A1]